MTPNFIKSVFVFVSFFIVQIIIHISIVSSITFFHLRLEHRLFDIQSWLNDFSYEVLTLGALLSVFIVIKVMQYRLTVTRSLKEVTSRFHRSFNKRDMAGILIFLSLSIFILQPELNSQRIQWQLLLNYVGSFFLYMTNVYLFAFTLSFYPLSKRTYKIFLILISTLLEFLFLKYIFLGSPKVSFLIFIHLAFLKSLLVFPIKRSLVTVLIFILFGIALLESLVGIGPFNSAHHSLFLSTRDFSNIEFLLLALLLIYYYKFRRNTD